MRVRSLFIHLFEILQDSQEESKEPHEIHPILQVTISGVPLNISRLFQQRNHAELITPCGTE